MTVINLLTSILKSRWTHYAVLVLGILASIGQIMSISKDKAQVKADLAMVKLALENKDSEYITLKTKYERLKVWEYTVTHTLPSGETTTTTTRITDSTVGSTEYNAGTEHTNYPPMGGNKTPDRLPVSALGFVSNDAWQAGIGYEALTFQLPLVPYKLHGTVGVAGGETWKGNLVGSGCLVLQFSKK